MVKKVGMSFGATPAPRKPAAQEPPEATRSAVVTTLPPTSSVPAQFHRDRRGELLATIHKDCKSRTEFAGEISRLWTEAQNRFVEIGRYLCEAKERLDHGEFIPMIESDLPFSYKVAQKLMAVAKAVDENIFPRDRLPPSYSTVYELLSLKEDERRLAVDEGVVRPDVSREEVLKFKRKLREQQPANQNVAVVPDQRKLRKRLEKLLAERQDIDRQIEEVRRLLEEAEQEA